MGILLRKIFGEVGSNICQYAGNSLVAQMGKSLPAMWFNSGVRKIPWRRKWLPTLVLLPGKSHGQRSLAGYSSRGRKEPETTEQPHFHSS